MPAMQAVIGVNPVVNQCQSVLSILEVWRCLPIALKPDHLRRIKQGGDSELVSMARVVPGQKDSG